MRGWDEGDPGTPQGLTHDGLFPRMNERMPAPIIAHADYRIEAAA